jgi:hypothetical protein
MAIPMAAALEKKCASHHLGCLCENCINKEQLNRECEKLTDEIIAAGENGDKIEVRRLTAKLAEIKKELSKY